MIADKKEFTKGLLLMMCFVVLLALIFMPLFGGKNGLEFSDDLYNSISKESAYYIPAIKEEIKEAAGKNVSMTLEVDVRQAENMAMLFRVAGASTTLGEGSIKVEGDLGAILSVCVEDTDSMFRNEEDEIEKKYGYQARQVLYNWWTACKAMDKNLKKQKLFKEASLVDHTKKKAVEPSYNYFGIEPQQLTDRLGVVLFSLVFYVVYTIWYGFGIMFLLEGWGLRLEH